MRWNRLWGSSSRTTSSQENGDGQQNNAQIHEAPTLTQPIIQAPSVGEASTSTYGTMVSRRRIGSVVSLSIPKGRTLRTERTEFTNVSPSSMHTYTPDPEDISHDDVDLAGFGAQHQGTGLLIKVDPAEPILNELEQDPLADITVVPEEPPDDEPEDPPTLEEELWDARIAWPEGKTSYFIPYDVLKRLVTTESILFELRRCDIQLSESELQEKADVILRTARKLFAALVCQTLGECILDFLKEDLSDKDMPFIRVELKKKDPKAGSFRLETRHHPKKVLQCMATPKWTRSKLEGFNRDQWWVLAPVFKESKKEHEEKKVRHWELDQNHVLPFIEDDRYASTNRGGFSEVCAVRIHPAHQRLYKGSNPKNPNPKIAIKRLFSTEEEDFKREIEMLKAFSHHSNHHLVKLLATYRYDDRYHLMFPLAAANLRTYWQISKVPEFSFETMKWSLLQCKGIASGLRSIHEYETTQPKAPPEPSSNDLAVPSNDRRDVSPFTNTQSTTQASKSTEFEAKFGRHGDIKPENILWSCEDIKDDCGNNDLGILLIADFGLMEFHREATRSKVPFDNIAVSPTYEPPDRSLKLDISRKYDIWSLGCVYLEFITWLVGGVELLSKFPDARDEKSFSGEINDDTFFSLRQNPNPEPNDPRKGMYAIVRPKVTDWIQSLRTKPRNSPFILDFLDLVENHMLKVNQDERISCAELNTLLADMVAEADKDPRYLTETRPLKCRDGQVVDGGMTPPSPTEGSALPKRHSFHALEGVMLEDVERARSPELKLNNATFMSE